MPSDTDEQRKEFMTRQESRKLLMMAAGLLVMLVFMFSSAFPSKPDDAAGPEVTIGRTASKTARDDGMLRMAEAPPHAGPFQDAKKALAAKIAHEDAKKRIERGELPQVTRETFKYDPSHLATVKDGELDKVEEPAFYALAAKVHFMTDEELKQAPKSEGTFTWDSLRSEEGRAEARGKFVTVEGRFLIPLWQRVLEKQPNEAGTELPWVWQGVLRVQNRGYVVSITDKNLEPTIGIGAQAYQVTGAFLKVYRYKTAQGEKSFPHLIVKNIQRAPKPATWNYMNSPIMWAVVIGFVIACIGTFVYARGSRASAERVDEWRRQKVIARAKAAAKAGEFEKARGGPSKPPAPEKDGADLGADPAPANLSPPVETAGTAAAEPATAEPTTAAEPATATAAEPATAAAAETGTEVADGVPEPETTLAEPAASAAKPEASTAEPETTVAEPELNAGEAKPTPGTGDEPRTEA